MVYSWIKCLLMLCITGNIPNVGLNSIHCKGLVNVQVYQTIRQSLNAENIFTGIIWFENARYRIQKAALVAGLQNQGNSCSRQKNRL